MFELRTSTTSTSWISEPGFARTGGQHLSAQLATRRKPDTRELSWSRVLNGDGRLEAIRPTVIFKSLHPRVRRSAHQQESDVAKLS